MIFAISNGCGDAIVIASGNVRVVKVCGCDCLHVEMKCGQISWGRKVPKNHCNRVLEFQECEFWKVVKELRQQTMLMPCLLQK